MARPASGVHLFLLDDEGVVFDEFRQEVLALNTAATAIWCLMEQGSGKAAIEDTLRAMFDLDPEQAATFTATALEDWTARGLLEGTMRLPARSRPLLRVPAPLRGSPTAADSSVLRHGAGGAGSSSARTSRGATGRNGLRARYHHDAAGDHALSRRHATPWLCRPGGTGSDGEGPGLAIRAVQW